LIANAIANAERREEIRELRQEEREIRLDNEIRREEHHHHRGW